MKNFGEISVRGDKSPICSCGWTQTVSLLLQLAEGIFKDVNLIFDVSNQAGDGRPIVDDINALGVGVVAHRERARNRPSILPIIIQQNRMI